MNPETSSSVLEAAGKITGHCWDVPARIEEHLYLVQLDSSLAEFHLPPSMRPFAPETNLDVVFEIRCTDGVLHVPAKARFTEETGAGSAYHLFGLSASNRQKLLNHLDNLTEGIQVTRSMLEEDKAPPLEERDFQLLEKNHELAAGAARGSKSRVRQLLLSFMFLVIIGFFGWLLFLSLFDIVSEDWGQQEYYSRISASRVKVAESQLREVDANLQFTRDMLQKLQDPRFSQGVSPLQVEIFQRDEKILEAHHDQMSEVVALLKIDRDAVAKGNFFYERRVLDSFSTQDRQTSTSSSAVLMMK
jgi:hypothetical protein